MCQAYVQFYQQCPAKFLNQIIPLWPIEFYPIRAVAFTSFGHLKCLKVIYMHACRSEGRSLCLPLVYLSDKISKIYDYFYIN